MLRISIVAALFIVLGNGASAQGPLVADLEPVRILRVQPDLVDEDGNPAKDVSGIACATTTGSKRPCLVINDENRSAQFAALDGGRGHGRGGFGLGSEGI